MKKFKIELLKEIQTPSHWMPTEELKKWIKNNKKQLKKKNK